MTENAIETAGIESSADDAKRQLAKVDTGAGIDLLTIGKAFAASGYFPDAKSQAQAITKILAGHELGISPVASMQGFYCIPRRKKVNGQWVEEVELAMSANLRAAVIQRDEKIDLRIVECTNEACEVEVAVKFAGQWERRGSVRFTIEDAQRAKVPGKGGEKRPLAEGSFWKNFPQDMLFAAVMRRIAKRHAPHLFIGQLPSSEDDDMIAAEREVALAEGEVVDEDQPVRSEYVNPPKGEAEDASEADGDGGPEDPGQEAAPDGADSHDVGRTEAEAEPAAEKRAEEPGTASAPALFEAEASEESAEVTDGVEDAREVTRRSGQPAPTDAAASETEAAGSDPPDPSNAADPRDGSSRARASSPLPAVFGLLEVVPAEGGPHTPAATDEELHTPQQITALQRILDRLGLVSGALAPIFETRYPGVPFPRARKTQCTELGQWLQVQQAKLVAEGKVTAE